RHSHLSVICVVKERFLLPQQRRRRTIHNLKPYSQPKNQKIPHPKQQPPVSQQYLIQHKH
ncbi:hypothetical protein, partial [Neisseria dentiae]|uniref:hypothetical protein n=1 Tax=Neisseria dentiae TaxID=194197 RepID=UPI00359FF835